MKIKKIVALTAACAMLSSTAGCQIITIDGEGTAEVGENGVVGNGAIGLSGRLFLDKKPESQIMRALHPCIHQLQNAVSGTW